MEFIDGQSLLDILARGRPPVASSVRWLVQALEGLHAAHESKILHRDLKPSNMFVRARDSSCVLIDFGFCKGDLIDSKYTTTEGVFVGTPQYASPEQTARKKDLTPASDVYAIGDDARVLRRC
jgi:serine/threonine protein kinase